MRYIALPSLIVLSLLSLTAVNAAPSRLAPAPLVGSAPALDGESEQRLNLLEKKMDNNVIYELVEQLRQLRLEISELREIAEQQDHKMTLLTKRQRSLYQDVDRRLLDLEAGSSSRGASVRAPVSNNQSSSGLGRGNNAAAPDMGDASPEQEQAAYTQAFKLLKEGNYPQAITAFRAFLDTYGSGKYADNAQYWLGEANYAVRDYKVALAEFQKILTNFPDSPKRKDAELKIGFTYYELKDWDAAKRSLQSVISQYPETTNARTAQQRIERLTREGR